MGQTIIIIAVILYFIKEQFEFSNVTKLTYFFIPLFSLYQFLTLFSYSNLNILFLFIILLASIFVGHFQARYSVVKIENIPIYYYQDTQGDEKEIYKKSVKVKGGKNYLFGWLIIFSIQLILQYIVNHQGFLVSEIGHELYEDILKDVLFIFRLADAKSKTAAWYVWAMYGTSSLAYTYFLAAKSPSVHAVLFRTKEAHSFTIEK